MIRVLRPMFPALSVHRMAQLLGVSRSLVYRRVRLRQAPALLPVVEQIVMTFLGYGYRRVLRELRSQGYACTEYGVRQLLRKQGLLARRPRSRGVTRMGVRDLRAANLLKGLSVSTSDAVWVADTTHIRTQAGPLYLAVLMDLHSRKIVSWQLSRRNDEQLTRACLDQALQQRRPSPSWIHHSDRGSPYTALAYTRRIRQAGGKVSLSRPGCPLENAHVESFFRTLKLEEVDRNRYASFLEAETALESYIDGLYNARRMHSSLGYTSPDQFEALQTGEAQ